VTATYAGGGEGRAGALVRFARPTLSPHGVGDAYAVKVPSEAVTLESRQPGYAFPDVTVFGDEAFGITARADVEHVLTVAADVQRELVRGDLVDVGGGFRQVILRDTTFGGMYSLWYGAPAAVAAHADAFGASPQYSSLIHELAHNATLNFPLAFPYGGRIDGPANAIYSEAVAQIVQHVTLMELSRQHDRYGLDEVTVRELELDALRSAQVVRVARDAYERAGHPFASYNDPLTAEDETFGTFMTLADLFIVHAERTGDVFTAGRRMLDLLARFDAASLQRYAPDIDDPEADAFRATLLVAAISHGVGLDLRDAARARGLPIDDAVYLALLF
jgi:hypothetical protein